MHNDIDVAPAQHSFNLIMEREGRDAFDIDVVLIDLNHLSSHRLSVINPELSRRISVGGGTPFGNDITILSRLINTIVFDITSSKNFIREAITQQEIDIYKMADNHKTGKIASVILSVYMDNGVEFEDDHLPIWVSYVEVLDGMIHEALGRILGGYVDVSTLIMYDHMLDIHKFCMCVSADIDMSVKRVSGLVSIEHNMLVKYLAIVNRAVEKRRSDTLY